MPTEMYDATRLRMSFHLTNPGLRLVQPVLAFASKFRLRVERKSDGQDVIEYVKFRTDPHAIKALWDASREPTRPGRTATI